MKTKELKNPDEWKQFCDFIIRKNRYVLNKKWTRFINAILFSSDKRETIFKTGTKLVRARIGSYYEESIKENGEIEISSGPLSPIELLAPPPDRTKDARINPRGISYLYLANNVETAILEVRSWIGQEVSVGYFEIIKDLKCIDTSKDKKKILIYLGKRKPALTPVEIEEHVWGDINDSFSRPVRTEDETINYIPTQYLAEFFKTNGYDGIIYKSALNEKGYNIVLFDPKNAVLKGARVFQIKSIKPIFEECDNPYSCKSLK